MPSTPPIPSPLLNEAPLSPEDVPAGPAPASGTFRALEPQVSLSADMQTTQLALETAAAVGKGLELLGQMFPQFGPVGASLQEQLQSALKTALEQGLSRPEPRASRANLTQLAGV